jgi:hypothetical protein
MPLSGDNWTVAAPRIMTGCTQTPRFSSSTAGILRLPEVSGRRTDDVEMLNDEHISRSGPGRCAIG